MSRKDIGKKVQTFGVGGIILDRKGEVLLTQRIDPSFPQWNGKLGIPGGHLKFGEDPKNALHRELREELGIEIEILQDNPFLVSKIFNLPKVIYHGIFLCYLCKIVNGKPKRKSIEHSGFKWLKPERIDFKECAPTTKEFIGHLLRCKSRF